jgi:hypothetical protein
MLVEGGIKASKQRACLPGAMMSRQDSRAAAGCRRMFDSPVASLAHTASARLRYDGAQGAQRFLAARRSDSPCVLHRTAARRCRSRACRRVSRMIWPPWNLSDSRRKGGGNDWRPTLWPASASEMSGRLDDSLFGRSLQTVRPLHV